ncbi:hypothetical protein BROUX41_003324 [Berkeleyomyces rouxiae]|uniref:uncharacterized protein n=1 Tax=Berkeleyomyces rouxiae TaxID=2035830 RepID=UPI003B7FDDB6
MSARVVLNLSRTAAPRRLALTTRAISNCAASQAQHHSGPEDTLLGGEQSRSRATASHAQEQAKKEDMPRNMASQLFADKSTAGSAASPQERNAGSKSRHAEIYQSA